MFPKHQRNYTFYQKSGALLIAIFGALSVADYSTPNKFLCVFAPYASLREITLLEMNYLLHPKEVFLRLCSLCVFA